jgi:hypothetical protein
MDKDNKSKDMKRGEWYKIAYKYLSEGYISNEDYERLSPKDKDYIKETTMIRRYNQE